MKSLHLIPAAVLLAASAAIAAPVTYKLDPTHTFPAFEADHMGMSKWRGMFTRTTGQVVLDKVAHEGTVDIVIATDSIEYGLPVMNKTAKSAELFDVAKYPKMTYKGRLDGWNGDTPTKVSGELTLHGVTKPVTLTLNSFKCMPHPMLKRDWCGADAVATIQRDEFGMTAGKPWGFKMDVTIRIQVEAVATP